MKQLTIHMHDKLYARIRKAARANGESVSGEIRVRLRNSFTKEDIKTIVREGLQTLAPQLDSKLQANFSNVIFLLKRELKKAPGRVEVILKDKR